MRMSKLGIAAARAGRAVVENPNATTQADVDDVPADQAAGERALARAGVADAPGRHSVSVSSATGTCPPSR